MAPSPASNSDGQREAKHSRVGILVGIVVATVLIAAVVSFFVFRSRQRKTRNMSMAEGNYLEKETTHLNFVEPIDEDIKNDRGPRKFIYNELAAATDKFSDSNMLGAGGFGTVYKGFLLDLNLTVAIKRLSERSHQGIKEYTSEVKTISNLQHRNLVRLVGWCHQLPELLLVYEFMANGSLDDHLFDNNKLLSWPIRYKIAKGLASALFYLHTELHQCIVHRDIKSSNVMLDDDFNAKLGDFGLARFIDHQVGKKTTVAAGTIGYMAPECYISGNTSKESDIYSFGIVLLEIACGKPHIDGNERLLDLVWRLYETDQVLQAADVRLNGEFNREEMERLMVVGLWCAHPDLNARFSIKQVIAALEFDIATMPCLPRKMPVFSYPLPPSTPLTCSSSTSGVVTSSTSVILASKGR